MVPIRSDDFTDPPESHSMDLRSDVEVLARAGKAARSAVGVAAYLII